MAKDFSASKQGVVKFVYSCRKVFFVVLVP